MPHRCWSRRIDEQEWYLHAGCDAGCRCRRHLRQVIMLEMVWPREQWDWWVAWSRHSRMSLSSTVKCKDHCLDDCARHHLAEPGHSWACWESTIRTVARSRTPHGQMLVRRKSVVSSGSVDRSNEGRRQDGTWYIRRFSDEVQ